MNLLEANKVCELIIQKYSKSFYMAFKDLP